MIRAACPEDVEAITTVLMESRRVFLPFAPIARPDLDVGQWCATASCRATECSSGRRAGWWLRC